MSTLKEVVDELSTLSPEDLYTQALMFGAVPAADWPPETLVRVIMAGCCVNRVITVLDREAEELGVRVARRSRHEITESVMEVALAAYARIKAAAASPIHKTGDLEVWHLSRPEGLGRRHATVRVPVAGAEEAARVLDALASYDRQLGDLIEWNSQGLERWEDGRWASARPDWREGFAR